MDVQRDDPTDVGRNGVKTINEDMETNDPTGVEKNRLNISQESSTAADLEVSLPFDVILSRLPVRSILRFKSVCKSWYALFSDPLFVEKHLKASMEDKDYANHSLIISSHNISMDVKSFSVHSILHEEEYSTPHPLDYPRRSSDTSDVWIVGSVHGLVFIIVDRVDLFLWNPSTRESKRLRKSGFEKNTHTAYGFGYDQSSSDYKVIVIKTGIDIQKNTGPFKSRVKIFGLKTYSWSKIENSLNCNMLSDSGKFVSGALHWSASFGTGLNYNLQGILTFNLSEGTFSEISQPGFEDGFLDSVIGVLDGCLCLLYNYDDKKVDVWVMKEYGKIESWSNMFSICFSNVPHTFQFSAPLFISRKNEMLLMIGLNLVLYNAEGNTVSRPVIQNVVVENIGVVNEVNTYIETLVSPCHK